MSSFEEIPLPTEEADIKGLLQSGVNLFNSIICPFGQRALWTALESKAPFKMVVVGLGNDMPESYGKQVNRYATVPCMYDNGVAVYESAIVAEYIDSKWNNGTLFARDSPAMMQLVRLLAAKFEIGAFYGLLRCHEEGEKRVALEKQIHDIMTELETIYRVNAAPYRADGPYLLGSRLSAAEIMIMPFIYRFNGLLQHYRKFEFVSKYPLVAAAFAASEGRQGFRESCRDMEFFIEKYRSYAIPAAP